MRKLVNLGFIILLLMGTIPAQAEVHPYVLEVGESRQYVFTGGLYEEINDIVYCDLNYEDLLLNITVDSITALDNALQTDMVGSVFTTEVNSTIAIGDQKYNHTSVLDGWIMHQFILDFDIAITLLLGHGVPGPGWFDESDLENSTIEDVLSTMYIFANTNASYYAELKENMEIAFTDSIVYNRTSPGNESYMNITHDAENSIFAYYVESGYSFSGTSGEDYYENYFRAHIDYEINYTSSWIERFNWKMTMHRLLGDLSLNRTYYYDVYPYVEPVEETSSDSSDSIETSNSTTTQSEPETNGGLDLPTMQMLITIVSIMIAERYRRRKRYQNQSRTSI